MDESTSLPTPPKTPTMAIEPRFNAELYNASRITIPAEGGRKKLVIIGDPRNWNFFCATEATADDVAGKSNGQKSVKGHQRRRGPSDTTPVNVAQSTAEYLIDPTLKSGNALPGKGFILKTTPGADTQEKRAFQYVGRSLDLIEYLDENVNYECYIYLENGARHTIKLGDAQAG